MPLFFFKFELDSLLYVCLGMIFTLMTYIHYIWRTRLHEDDKPEKNKGLSISVLRKLPKVTGKDLGLDTYCAVCVSEIESCQSARMIPGCNHGFHLQCIDTWLVLNAVCPLCRANVGPEFFTASQTDLC